MAFTKDGPGNGRNSISPIIDKNYGLSLISKKDDDIVEINGFSDPAEGCCGSCGGAGSAQVEKEEDIIL